MTYSQALLNAVRTARQIAGTPIVYRQGAAVISMTAAVGQTVFRVDTPAGGTLRVETRDYLIEQADLAAGGQPLEPADGDTIDEAGRTYQVVSVGGEPHYRYCDPAQTQLRIHTQRVA